MLGLVGCKNGHGRESGRCAEKGDSPKETVRRNFIALYRIAADVWRGLLSWIPFKVLLYDDMAGVVTSRHVTKMAVTLFDPPCAMAETPRYTQTSRPCLL